MIFHIFFTKYVLLYFRFWATWTLQHILFLENLYPSINACNHPSDPSFSGRTKDAEALLKVSIQAGPQLTRLPALLNSASWRALGTYDGKPRSPRSLSFRRWTVGFSPWISILMWENSGWMWINSLSVFWTMKKTDTKSDPKADFPWWRTGGPTLLFAAGYDRV